MSEPLEIELKLEVSREDADRLAHAPSIADSAGTRAHLVSTYFDTPGMDVREAGYSLRIRRDGRSHVQTIKADREGSGLFVRSEWERPVKGRRPIIDEEGGPLSDALDKPMRAQVEQQFVTDISRTTHVISAGGSRFEVAVDLGEIRAGGRRQDLCEVELELEEGTPAPLFDFARALDEQVPLRLSVRSKAERGYDLLQAATGEAVKAEPIALEGDGSVADAFAAIARSCIRQFRLNEEILLETGSAESLHQARVGLRRLRSAFSLFKSLFVHDDRAEMLRSELRWIAAELGKVRNLDVLIERADSALAYELTAARTRTFLHVSAELASARTRLLMIDLAEWLALGNWRLHSNYPALAGRAKVAATEILEKHRRRLKRIGKGLADLPDEERHEVRIEAKKMRYAAEFFASLYTDKRARRRQKSFVGTLEELQNHLGELNDMVVGPRVIAEHGISQALPLPRKRDRQKLLYKAEDAFDEWVDAKKFW